MKIDICLLSDKFNFVSYLFAIIGIIKDKKMHKLIANNLIYKN